jgi:phosphoribosylamine---glycine ligase
MESSLRPADGAAVGVVVASEGYPEAPLTGRMLEGAEPSSAGGNGEMLAFHGGTRRQPDGTVETTGGRAVTLVGRGPTLAEARAAAYRGVADLGLEGAQFRTDVGELHVDDRAELGDEAR